MGEDNKITGVQAVTKDEPCRVTIRKDGGKHERLGVGLENFDDGKFWLWMGDGNTTLAVQMTNDEVSHFAMALGLFPQSEYATEKKTKRWWQRPGG